MTNKKLKLAAMSVALTACVAAQPMAAHAVEGPDPAEDNAAPQAEPAPVEGKTAEGEVEGKEGKQEEIRNEKHKDAVDTIAAMTLRWIMITAKIPSPTTRTVPPPLTAPVL